MNAAINDRGPPKQRDSKKELDARHVQEFQPVYVFIFC